MSRPTVTMFEVLPARESESDDVSSATIRACACCDPIENRRLIPGKSAVGIEIPNRSGISSAKEMLRRYREDEDRFSGEPSWMKTGDDMSSSPHLPTPSTRSGKAYASTVAYHPLRTPKRVRMIMVIQDGRAQYLQRNHLLLRSFPMNGRSRRLTSVSSRWRAI